MKITFKEFSKIVNQTVNDVITASDLFDVFQDDIYSGYPLPKEITPELWKNLTYISGIYPIFIKFSKKEQKQLAANNFLYEMINLFEERIQNKSNLKFSFYSAHGTIFFYLKNSNHS